MATDDQKTNLGGAIGQIESAEQDLLKASNEATDQAKALLIAAQYRKQDALLSQMLQAQAHADDASFAEEAAALNAQSDVLKADATAIQTIVDDVGEAAKIAKYLTDAAGFLAKL